MKSNTKSSITLPASELATVKRLQRALKMKSKVQVVRAGLQLLDDSTQRESLRRQFAEAAERVRDGTREALRDLDHLAGEMLE
jgi:hypothetical protein